VVRSGSFRSAPPSRSLTYSLLGASPPPLPFFRVDVLFTSLRSQLLISARTTLRPFNSRVLRQASSSHCSPPPASSAFPYLFLFGDTSRTSHPAATRFCRAQARHAGHLLSRKNSLSLQIADAHTSLEATVSGRASSPSCHLPLHVIRSRTTNVLIAASRSSFHECVMP